MAKKSDIKIRKTRGVSRERFVFGQTFAAIAQNCASEILSQDCASQDGLWISDSQVEDPLSLPAIVEHNAGFVEVKALVVDSTKKRSHAALLIPLVLLAVDVGLKIWRAESIPGGLLSVAAAVVWLVLELRGYGLRSWIDEEAKPRKGEGKGGLL